MLLFGESHSVRSTSASPPHGRQKYQRFAKRHRRYRVLAAVTHPVQYLTPIFHRKAKHSSLDLQAAGNV
jgi:hypothetical protein